MQQDTPAGGPAEKNSNNLASGTVTNYDTSSKPNNEKENGMSAWDTTTLPCDPLRENTSMLSSKLVGNTEAESDYDTNAGHGFNDLFADLFVKQRQYSESGSLTLCSSQILSREAQWSWHGELVDLGVVGGSPVLSATLYQPTYSFHKSGRYFKPLAPYTSPCLLYLDKGDIVEIFLRLASGWILGRIRGDKSRYGWFPEYLLQTPESLIVKLLMDVNAEASSSSGLSEERIPDPAQ